MLAPSFSVVRESIIILKGTSAVSASVSNVKVLIVGGGWAHLSSLEGSGDASRPSTTHHQGGFEFRFPERRKDAGRRTQPNICFAHCYLDTVRHPLPDLQVYDVAFFSLRS